VCATQNKNEALFTAIDTWCINRPAAILIVATPRCAVWIRERVKSLQSAVPIDIIEHSETHKRRQLCAGFKIAKTEYIIICDDDTRWTKGVLENLLRPLVVRKDLGCAFPDLRVDPVGNKFTLWERLGLLRHVGDGVDFHASLHVDGGVFCHHGSTAAYRASILQDAKFVDAFTNDRWRGHLLNSGDDQFLCRWLVNNDWKVALCSAETCLVQTRSRASWRHMLQLLRWSRNDFRSSLAGLIWERKMWK
jgi:cellulose synthase/poly-beta-1,6-N-acetylglucosamine synthase-like glycosyltransferase